MYLCMGYVHMGAVPMEARGGHQISSGDSGGCELLGVSAGN